MKKLVLAFLVVLSSTALMAQMKIGHVNTQRLLDTMPSRKAAMVSLDKFQRDGFNELREMDSALNAAAQKLEATAPTLSPTMLKIEQQKLYTKQQALQDRQASLEQEMQIYSEELNAPILDRIKKSVAIVAERKKLSYIIDETSVLYFDKAMDCTQEVMIELMKLEKAVNP